MLRTLRFAFATLVILSVVGPAASAFAAPVGWETVNVTLHTEPQQSTVLVSGTLPASAKLPFETELAVPAGTQLQWVGELLGGPAADDPELKYVKSTVRGMDVYRFTLTKSRTAQVEAVTQGVNGLDGANQSTMLKWTVWRALPEVSMSARIPAGAEIVKAAAGAEVRSGEQGYGYYSKTVKSPKTGDVLDLTFSYALPAGTAAPVAGATGSNALAVVSVLAVFIGGLGLLIFSVRRKMAVKAADGDEQSGHTQASTTSGTSSAVVAEEQQAEPGPSPVRRVKPAVVVLGVLGVLVVGVVTAVGLSTSVPVVDGKMTKFFGAASPCTSATIQVVANEGVDLASQGMQLVDAFKGQENIGDVTLDIARSTVEVSFCESSQSAASVGNILAGTGLVSVVAGPEPSVPESAGPQ